nr:hypothetical protein [Tanacetum cinerariifolium]
VASEQDELPSSVKLDDEAAVRYTQDILSISVVKLTTGRSVNGLFCGGSDMVIKNFDLEPKIDAMIRDSLDPFRWKELSKETSSKILSCGDGSCWKTFKPTCEPSAEEFTNFLDLYPVPSEYYVMLPKPNQTIFDAPDGNFIYAENDDDIYFLPKEPSVDFGTGSPSISINTEPQVVEFVPIDQPAKNTADSKHSPCREEYLIHPKSVVARIRERKCGTRGGSSKPSIKRKLVQGAFTQF